MVVLVIVVRSPANDWTFRSVAYSLQDGCLACICTSYNKDSERYLWALTVGCYGNRVFVRHVSRLCEGRVAYRYDPHKYPTPSFFGDLGAMSPRRSTHVTPIPSSLRFSAKLTFPHLTYTVPRNVTSLATLLPYCI